MNRFLQAIILLLGGTAGVRAQNACPPNIDFELGSLNNWNCYTGINNPPQPVSWSLTGPVSGRHSITTGGGVDPYGGFSIVAPGGGAYSMMLGNSNVGAETEKVTYTLNVPAGNNAYSLYFRYAVVFQNPPNHLPFQQPFFKILAYDAVTGLQIPCDSNMFISSGNLPGFIETSNGSGIWYKDWSAGTLKLDGQAGRTINIEFTSADCSPGAHFGYGYVDMNCGNYGIISANCNHSAVTPLTGPPGFQSYVWYDGSYASVLGTSRTITVNTPAGNPTYHVVLTPYPGYGCIDTLSAQIRYSTLTVDATPDTADLCTIQSAQLATTQVGSAPPYSYTWQPATGLSCISCPNPVASPVLNTRYLVSVTDTNGCTIQDSVYIIAGVSLAETHTNVTCQNAANGNATISAVGGTPPYTYRWNTSPVQTGQTAVNLGPGTYTGTATDAKGCIGSKTIIITQPPALTVAGSTTAPLCQNVNTGSATMNVTGGTPPYTYSWNTSPVQTGQTAVNLGPGTYTGTVTDAKGCAASVTQTILPSSAILVNTSVVNRPCPGLAEASVLGTASGGHGTLYYAWNTVPVQTTPGLNNIPAGTYILTVTDAAGCRATDTLVVTEYTAPVVTASPDQEICQGVQVPLAANGAAYYIWSPAAGLTCTSCTNPVATPQATITYQVIGRDVHGCADTASVTVSVIPHVPVSADTGRKICLGDKIMLGAHGGQYYEWSPAETLDGPFLPTPVATPVRTTNYRVIITENHCFRDTLYQHIDVLPLPAIDIIHGFTGIPGATVQLHTTTTTGVQSIRWTPPAGLSCTDCYDPLATLDKNIIYLAEVTDSNGCKAVDTVQITVSCDGSVFYMANTFTPNNDGRNDYFFPQAFAVNKVQRFMVYNRWGEIMFSAADMPVNVPEKGWNGQYKGKELGPDVFVYVVEAICTDGTPVVVKGDVALIR